MYLTIQGLVLRVTAYKDSDALLTLLTPDRGKLTVKARGLRRKNSPLVAPCQLLALGEFTLFEYRGMHFQNWMFLRILLRQFLSYGAHALPAICLILSAATNVGTHILSGLIFLRDGWSV